MVLARELTLAQIRRSAPLGAGRHAGILHPRRAVRGLQRPCFISHAHTGRSANRGNCSQECRLPYTVTDAQGRIVAHDKHVLSMKDNDQSANLARAGRRRHPQLQDRGPLQGHGYCEERHRALPPLLDELIDVAAELAQGLRRAAAASPSRPTRAELQPRFTDYFVNGRRDDIGAFDTPKHAGIGWVTRSVGRRDFELDTDDAARCCTTATA